MKPYYADDWVTIYHGDCRDVLPTISGDVLITDPPYGIAYRTPPSPSRPKSDWSLAGDAEPFDPSLLLGYQRAVIFGANHFADKLPPSPGWFVWDKRVGMPSNDQGDAELAWTNILGSVRIIRCLWNGGGSLLAENGPARAIHPTQKPLSLMRSVVLAVSSAGEVVVDPYAGTGTTLRAAKRPQPPCDRRRDRGALLRDRCPPLRAGSTRLGRRGLADSNQRSRRLSGRASR